MKLICRDCGWKGEETELVLRFIVNRDNVDAEPACPSCGSWWIVEFIPISEVIDKAISALKELESCIKEAINNYGKSR